MFQLLLPKLLVLGTEVCFYDCSGFCVNELKFHFSGAPCMCQHILQIESCAGRASTHLLHRLLLIGSVPHKPSPEDRGKQRRGRGSQQELFMSAISPDPSKAQRMRLHFISL